MPRDSAPSRSTVTALTAETAAARLYELWCEAQRTGSVGLVRAGALEGSVSLFVAKPGGLEISIWGPDIAQERYLIPHEEVARMRINGRQFAATAEHGVRLFGVFAPLLDAIAALRRVRMAEARFGAGEARPPHAQRRPRRAPRTRPVITPVERRVARSAF